MGLKYDLQKAVDSFFTGDYEITKGNVIPDVEDIKFGKNGRELELAMMFIDIRESTRIVGALQRTTAARMYKSFLGGVAKIARANNGELRSFNGDGVLIVFIGSTKRTDAVRAALQMSWFCQKILQPKLEKYFENNSILKDSEFDFGIGIDEGKVLVVRGGIRGDNNNDLVWAGNATNYAVKLSGLSKEGRHIYISKNVYDNMLETIGNTHKKDMWEPRVSSDLGGITVYRTSYWLPLS